MIREEAKKLEAEAQQLETVGWGKLREAVMESEAEGFYGLLRGVTLHSRPLPSQPPPSCACLSPSSPVLQQSPQESTGPEVSGPIGPATVSASVAATPAPESDILADMQPLRIQLGGAKRVYQCQVEGCKEVSINLMGSHLCLCEEGTPRSGVGVPTLQ